MKQNIAIIGGGPGGLMAAEVLAGSGCKVTIYDRMPSVGRKFLMAGRGGLNLTHSEPLEYFMKRYGAAESWLKPHIEAFDPVMLRKWCEGLGQETFVGSSGRVFPKVMKAAPLLRAWLKRLNELGVEFKGRHLWQGFDGDALVFTNDKQEKILIKADATLLALGGASWPKLGSDGSWTKILAEEGVEISELRPANSGFIINWSEHFRSKFSGIPLKQVMLKHKNISRQGEVMITNTGIEGSGIYAMSSALRESIEKEGRAELHLDLRPNISLEELCHKLASRGSQSLSNYLRKLGLAPVAISLLHEVEEPADIAERIKSLPLVLTATTGLTRAISTAGGIRQQSLDKNFMLIKKPGVFACGEMLDWEAPTGGYLLQACFSTAIAAAKGISGSLYS